MGRKRQHHVVLDDNELQYLKSLVRKGKHSASKLNRARILLMAHEGKTDAQIVEALGVGRSSPQRIRKRFVTEGIALVERRHGGGPTPILDAKAEAITCEIAISKPPEGRNKWTLQLIADRLVKLSVVDSVSADTVGRALKKRGLSQVVARSGASRK